MKRTLVQFLARPVTTYVTAAVAALLIVCTVTTGIFSDDSLLLQLLTVLLCSFATLFGLLSWFAYVLNARRVTRQMNRKLHEELSKHVEYFKQHSLKSQDMVLKELTSAKQQHLEQYEKQAYHVQIGLQKLRLAALNERE